MHINRKGKTPFTQTKCNLKGKKYFRGQQKIYIKKVDYFANLKELFKTERTMRLKKGTIWQEAHFKEPS